MRLLTIVGILALMIPSWSDYRQFSVTSADMKKFMDQCYRQPSQTEMKAEIAALLISRREKSPPNLPTELSIKSKSYPFVQLNGLNLVNVKSGDLSVVMDLTRPADAKYFFYKDDFPVDIKRLDNGGYKCQQRCVSDKCKGDNTQPLDLSSLNNGPDCSDALCATQKMFGEEKGTVLLWNYLKYGANFSPYAYRGLVDNVVEFNIDELNALSAANEAIPEHLRPVSEKDQNFFRVARNSDKIANAYGMIYNRFGSLDKYEKVAAITHELGHRTSNLEKSFYHESDEWLEATGWEKTNDPRIGEFLNRNLRQGDWVSEYQGANPAEDYAETFNAYRFTPDRLKKSSPTRYQFMKEKIFNGLEFDRELCHGQVNPPNESAPLTAPEIQY